MCVSQARQAHVALSQVRSLEGLRLEELDCNKVKGQKICNRVTLIEKQRLRQFAGTVLYELIQHFKQNRLFDTF